MCYVIFSQPISSPPAALPRNRRILDGVTGQTTDLSSGAPVRRFAYKDFTANGNPYPDGISAARHSHTAQLITAMLKSNTHVSDLIFSPGRAPQIEVSGQLVELKYKGLECLSAADTKSIAYDIMGENEHPLRKLDADGSADLSYGLPGVGRFRVNIFRQRGSCAIVMRVSPTRFPASMT